MDSIDGSIHWGHRAPLLAEAAPGLAIGCFGLTCRTRFADLLVAFGRAAPDVDVGVRELPRGTLLPALLAGELDAVVMPRRPLTACPHVPLWRDRAMVALAVDHPLAAQTELSVAELTDATFLMPRSGHGAEMHRFLAEQAGAGTTLTGELVADNQSLMLERVAAGDALALVPETLPVGPDIRRLPIGEARGGYTVCAYWRDRAPGAPLAQLITALRNAADPGLG